MKWTMLFPIIFICLNSIHVNGQEVNLIVNPSFENGNTNFISEYTYTTSLTFVSGTYGIESNPSNHNPFYTSCGDHTTGGGKMMVVDGSQSPTLKLWSQVIPVNPYTKYTFGYWIQNVNNNEGHLGVLYTYINNILIGGAVSPTSALPCGNWVRKAFTWYSDIATSAEIIIYDTTTSPANNDVAIDDLFFLDTSKTKVICPGGNIKVIASNYDINKSYQWQVNTGNGFTNITNSGIYSGTNTDTLAITNAPYSNYGYQYKCIISDISETLESLPFVLKFQDTWIGEVDNKWETSSNWSCNVVPDGNLDVIINSGNVFINSNAICRSLLVSPDAKVTITNGFNLTVLH